MAFVKGERPRDASYASGGGQLGRVRDFTKEHVEFRDPDHGKRDSADVAGVTADYDNKYAKSGEGQGTGMYAAPKIKREGDSKSLAPVKPRK